MAEKRGMGRGLSAILPARYDELLLDEFRQLPVVAIDANRDQPRTNFDADELTALAESIRRNGVLQPLLVRPVAGGRYELIAGERRLRAARLAGLETVPSYVRAELDANNLELALIENMARVDLNPIDAARACAALVGDLGLTKEEVAGRVGKSRVAVSNLIRLLGLPDDVIALVERGELSEGHGRALLRASDHFSRRQLARQAVEQGWSVRETERRAEQEASSTYNADSNGKVEEESKHASDRTARVEAAEAVASIAERFAALIGAEPKVRVTGRGVKVQLEFADVAEALAAADALRRAG